jgi:hypothetical protein
LGIILKLNLVKRALLLIVQDTFALVKDASGKPTVLIVHPDLPVPAAGWKVRTEPVTIERPDGSNLETTAQISLSHFNIHDPSVSIDRRWRVTISFANTSAEDVPVGSRVLVSPVTKDELLGG